MIWTAISELDVHGYIPGINTWDIGVVVSSVIDELFEDTCSMEELKNLMFKVNDEL